MEAKQDASTAPTAEKEILTKEPAGENLRKMKEEIKSSFVTLQKEFCTKVEALCAQLQEKTQGTVDKELAKLEKEKQDVEEFKASLLDFSKRKGSEKIKLNIGGTIFMTTVSTLTNEHSMLAAMFSSQFNTQADEDGEYFIDRNPKHFALILDYLRTSQVVKTGLSQRELEELKLEVEFYQLRGLENLLFSVPEEEEKPSPSTTEYKWNPGRKDYRVLLTDNGITAQGSAGTGCAYKSVQAFTALLDGVFQWEITLNQYADCYSAVGVATANFDLANGQMGMDAESWGVSLYPGSHSPSGDKRVQVPARLLQGSKVRCKYDSTGSTLTVNVLSDGTNVSFTKLFNNVPSTSTRPLYPVLTVCELTSGGYTIRPLTTF